MTTATKRTEWHASRLRTIGASPGIDISASDGSNICIVHPQDGGDAETIRVARLIAVAPNMLMALDRIAAPHDCGCSPCTGQCRSQLALEITVDELREIARCAVFIANQEPVNDPGL